MTTEQQELRLDKMIALFEQRLNIQMIAISLSEIFNPDYMLGLALLQSNIIHYYTIKSQTIHPTFKSGGYVNNRPEWVEEMLKPNNRTVGNYKSN